MNHFERLTAGMKEVEELLDSPRLMPDPSRKDWPDQVQAVAHLTARVEGEVLEPLPLVLAELDDESDTRTLRESIQSMLGEVGAIHHLARTGDANSWWTRALRLVTGDAELEAAMDDPDAYVLLSAARWNHRKSKMGAADRFYKKCASSARSDVLREAANRAFNMPRPMKSAPPLFRINGCGAALYGERDAWPNGAHVATYCICLLFIPIIPLAAYRVVDHGDGSFSFLAKERLSGFAKGWLTLIAASVALFIGTGVVTGYLNSPGRQAGIAYEEAQKFEASGDLVKARAEYSRIADEFVYGSGEESALQAGRDFVRLEAARVNAPVSSASLAEIQRFASAVGKLPQRVRSEIGEEVGNHFVGWLDALAGAEANRDAALEIARLGGPLAGGVASQRITEVRTQLQLTVAKAKEKEWPLSALPLYVELKNSADGRAAIARVLSRVEDEPALIFAHAVELSAAAQALGPTDAVGKRMLERIVKARTVYWRRAASRLATQRT